MLLLLLLQLLQLLLLVLLLLLLLAARAAAGSCCYCSCIMSGRIVYMGWESNTAGVTFPSAIACLIDRLWDFSPSV